MEIRTRADGQKKPKPIDKDSRGTAIAIGLRVAYNFSGSVTMGHISEIRNIEWTPIKGRVNMWRTWECRYKIKVTNEDGHTSTIKNPNSFIVI